MTAAANQERGMTMTKAAYTESIAGLTLGQDEPTAVQFRIHDVLQSFGNDCVKFSSVTSVVS